MLVLVSATLSLTRRSGVQRVVVETARALAKIAKVDCVRWDHLEGGLRFFDAAEFDALFGAGDWPEGLDLRRDARRVGRPFREALTAPEHTWLFNPEIAHATVHGVETLSRIHTTCRESGVRVASVFYDLIPLIHPAYAGMRDRHAAYVAELVRGDLVLPISRFVAGRLVDLWRGAGVETTPTITAVLLPNGGLARGRSPATARPSASTIVLVGTVEPRKRQVEVLEAIGRARRRSPAVAARRVVVVGSLSGDVARAFNAFLARNPWVEHLDYASDARVSQAFAEADFSVFASIEEGYGLPIAESLAHGCPCLCADFGAMAEVAEGGGCLTVDVRDEAVLEQAVVDLCEDAALRERLRGQAAARTFETWDDYARRILEAMAAVAPLDGAPVNVATAPVSGLQALSAEAFAGLARSDLIVCPTPQARIEVIEEAACRAWPELLPPLPSADEAEAVQGRIGARRCKAQRIAAVEDSYARARRVIAPNGAGPPLFLRVMISTFQRRAFVVANVRWLLDKVIGREGDVDLVVVDGGSTDGTVQALKQIADPRLTVIASPVNVGMLSAWREAARLHGAEYVWVVGDDDFIAPRAFQAIKAALRDNAGVVAGVVNFSVYHRAAWTKHARVVDVIVEAQPVAQGVAPSGIMPLRRAAEQTDNLFTAIYTLIWRADVLCAAYDHAFDGAPFSNLVEAIPCTDILLRTFSECDAYWHGETAIYGNAHNSWSRHRPRWHGVVMPMAFELAREAGVDAAKLQRGAESHLKLLREALVIAQDRGEPHGLDAAMLARAYGQFRTDVAAEIPA